MAGTLDVVVQVLPEESSFAPDGQEYVAVAFAVMVKLRALLVPFAVMTLTLCPLGETIITF